MEDLMLKIVEVAARLRISSACAYALVESGQLGCYRVGLGRGAIRVTEEHLHAYLEAREQGGKKTSPRLTRPRLKHLS